MRTVLLKMSEKIILVFCINFLPTNVLGHIPIHITTPSSKIDQHCELADTCIHDSIPICGMMGDEKRTFLDICDMIEYVCDNNKIFAHVDDVPGCPKKKNSL